jgi:hypothetical protein
MLSICDARFLDALSAQAKEHGKLAADFVIPDAWRRHQPQHLQQSLEPFRRKKVLPQFPFGSDFDEVEQRLLPALAWLQACAGHWRGRWQLLRALYRPGNVAAREGEALLRMGLAHPTKPLDRLQRRLLQAALRRKA